MLNKFEKDYLLYSFNSNSQEEIKYFIDFCNTEKENWYSSFTFMIKNITIR
jgi:hypothetical protein